MTRKGSYDFTPEGVVGGIFQPGMADMAQAALEERRRRRAAESAQSLADDAGTIPEPEPPLSSASTSHTSTVGPVANMTPDLAPYSAPIPAPNRHTASIGSAVNMTQQQQQPAYAQPVSSRPHFVAETDVNLTQHARHEEPRGHVSNRPQQSAPPVVKLTQPSDSAPILEPVSTRRQAERQPSVNMPPPQSEPRQVRQTGTAPKRKSAAGPTASRSAKRKPAAEPTSRGHREPLGKNIRRTLRMNATTDTYLRALSDMMGTTVNDAVSVAIVEHYVYLTMQGMKGR